MNYFEENFNRVSVVDEFKCMEEFSNYSERGTEDLGEKFYIVGCI